MYNDFQELLIIDDDCCHNIVCSLALKKIFCTADFKMTLFTNSEEGLDYIIHLAISKKILLLLDVNMPKLSGWQVLNELEQLPEAIKKYLEVYLLTASPNEDDMERAMSSSLVKEYLEKPLSDHLQSIFVTRSLRLSVA